MEGKEFYFQLVREGCKKPFFLITPKKYYDTEGCLSDESGVASEALPEGFSELLESHYEFDGNPDAGRQYLLDAGFEEIDFGFNNRVEPVENGDEEYHDEEHEYDDEERDEDDLDSLLNETDSNVSAPTAPGDYSNVATDKLMRHLQMMLKCESFEEAAKIRDELNSRGVTIES